MAREITVSIWCDACLQRGEHVPGVELPPLSLMPTRKPKVVALCEPDRKALYVPLLDLLAERGALVPDGGLEPPTVKSVAAVKAEQQAERDKTNGPYTCPVCGYKSRTLGGARSHASASHNTTWGELNGETADVQCPDCTRKFTSQQGLALHRTRAHEVPR